MPLGSLPRLVLGAALDAVLPPRCLVCRQTEWAGGALCTRCAGRLPEVGRRCPRCGRRTGPFGAVDPCPGCAEEDLRLDGVVVAWSYAGAARDLVLALKFQGRPAAAAPLAAALADALRAHQLPGDLLVPVPLSPRRRRRRGYDQAALLARALAQRLDLEVEASALVRVRNLPPQTSLSRRRRLRSPRGAFRARRDPLRGRSVLLVDDVLTTGATASACATALRRAGALSVVAAVACRTEGGPR